MKAAEGGQRNGAARAGLQHEAGDADSGRWRIDGRHAGLRCWARPNQPRPHHLRTSSKRAGLDSRNFAAPIRQILARAIAHAVKSTIERVFTQPGPQGDIRGEARLPP